MRIRFDEAARTEKHFTCAILPHLLMCEDFSGLKKLFGLLNICPERVESEDFEVVAELEPLRDGAIGNGTIDKFRREHGRLAVPDLFLRWANSILIIEAKFFTYPNLEKLTSQVKAQVDAIAMIRDETIYDHTFTFTHLILTVPGFHPEALKSVTDSIRFLTWNDIFELLDAQPRPGSKDYTYALQLLRAAIGRSKPVLPRSDDKERFKSLADLILARPRLEQEGKTFIGFEGGARKLERTSLSVLENRVQYLASAHRDNPNWIPIETFFQYHASLSRGLPSGDRGQPEPLREPAKTTERFNSLRELLQALPRLEREDKRYVGFQGGLGKMLGTSRTGLENRNRYLVSATSDNANWIPIDELLRHYAASE